MKKSGKTDTFESEKNISFIKLYNERTLCVAICFKVELIPFHLNHHTEITLKKYVI